MNVASLLRHAVQPAPGGVIGRSGWTPMTRTVPGDADRDGGPDLLVRATATGIRHLYRGSPPFHDRTVYGTGRYWLTGSPTCGRRVGDGTSQFYAGGTNPAGGERTQVGEGGWAGIAAIG
ncbi:hypothetical protein [Actinoplanes xinjiangensis]|uniref:hypothetical protein n=1 Tax=Actinoplanes xinjiangensis TaxID=512350 RepID=UPI00342A90C7